MNKYLWIFLSVILIVGSGCGTKEESSPTQAAPQPKVTEQGAPQDFAVIGNIGNPTDVADNNSSYHKGETASADIAPLASSTESVAGIESTESEEGAKSFARSQLDTITSGSNWAEAGGISTAMVKKYRE